MECQRCKKPITVQVNRKVELQWQTLLYCENCDISYEASGEHRCSDCNLSLNDYLESETLGCSGCYQSFRSFLNELLSSKISYPHSLTRRPSNSDRLARPRTEELIEYVTGKKVDLAHRTKPLTSSKISNSNTPSLFEIDSQKLDELFSQNIILSCRLRVARNLVSLPYLKLLSGRSQSRLAEILLAPGGVLSTLSGNRLVKTTTYSGDEDHLRASWQLPVSSFLGFKRGLELAISELNSIEESYIWQFSPDFGYLTACPANSGSGIKYSFHFDRAKLSQISELSHFKYGLISEGYSQGRAQNLAQHPLELSKIDNNGIESIFTTMTAELATISRLIIQDKRR